MIEATIFDLDGDPETIRENQWPHNVALVEQVRQKCRYVALATVSHCGPTQQILRALGLRGAFDFIATMGKPTRFSARRWLHGTPAR